ncbi:hypothetical protein BRE01_60330 [Brevibacillus reuszeri]|uniref:Uncharacterized protein n=1 Tax=Brevibacillus reuszeri TaxID=54915 RepID=A0A0K9YNH3_9BACL|nr:hypothetical protein [Brevibacillus reuszeri]KNB70221.1 hypothetical protein ADS79_14730 [Brevibacillus reuszeri]MED1859176.1 hypothetical protein [Brevibacillus reuszeri]GED72331.1 hypothetical protein BRE01_60330 [Brevibacillus reuszeri]
MEKLSATEIIRRKALQILAVYPEGVSSASLKAMTEKELGEIFEPDSYNRGKYRSALYNLHVILPQLVKRDDETKKFFPTQKLRKDSVLITIPSMDELKEHFGKLKAVKYEELAAKELTKTEIKEEQEKIYESKLPDNEEMISMLKILLIRKKVVDLTNHIKESGILELLNITPNETKHISFDEYEAIFRLKIQIEALDMYRKLIDTEKL